MPALFTSTSRRPSAVPVRRDELLDLLLVGHVGRHGLDVEALAAQLLGRRLELVGAPRRDRQAVAVLAQRPGDGEADSAGSSGDECRALHWRGHFSSLSLASRRVRICGSRLWRCPARGRARRRAAAATTRATSRRRRPRARRTSRRRTGKTLRRAPRRASAAGPVLAPSGQEFRTGKQRFGFALFRPRPLADHERERRAVRGARRRRAGEGAVPRALRVAVGASRSSRAARRRPTRTPPSRSTRRRSRSTSRAATRCSASRSRARSSWPRRCRRPASW